MRGRKPIPTHLKLINGNPGRRRLNDREAVVPVELPEPPEHLKGDALTEWRRITRLLADAGLMTRLDMAVVAAYCVAWARWIECERTIEQSGMTMPTKSGWPLCSPYLTEANRAMVQLCRFAEQIGLSGSARSRIKAGITADRCSDSAEAFLNVRG